LRRLRSRSEAGVTLVEVTVTSAVLLAVVAVFFAQLGSMQKTSQFASTRTEALDALRLAAARFTKDTRQASGVTVATAEQVVLETYVGAARTTVTYALVSSGTTTVLRRKQGSGQAVDLVTRLRTPSFFAYDTTDVTNVARVRLVLSTRPDSRHDAVSISTQASFRNV
jgi:type II secretory pathway component PulJ